MDELEKFLKGASISADNSAKDVQRNGDASSREVRFP